MKNRHGNLREAGAALYPLSGFTATLCDPSAYCLTRWLGQRRARDLLTAKGFDTRDAVLTCYFGADFHPDLMADRRNDVRLIDLEKLYAD